MSWTQPSMFDTPSTAHARKGDPLGSHMTLASLSADTNLKSMLLYGTLRLYHTNHQPLTDDDLLDYCEAKTGRRFQRNVIARTRGLLEQDEWLTRVPSVTGRTGRPTVAFIPSQQLVNKITE